MHEQSGNEVGKRARAKAPPSREEEEEEVWDGGVLVAFERPHLPPEQ
jgi:hypothetical protein